MGNAANYSQAIFDFICYSFAPESSIAWMMPANPLPWVQRKYRRAHGRGHAYAGARPTGPVRVRCSHRLCSDSGCGGARRNRLASRRTRCWIFYESRRSAHNPSAYVDVGEPLPCWSRYKRSRTCGNGSGTTFWSPCQQPRPACPPLKIEKE